MCEQTEINYLDGEVVWVKLGSCWWPGEVVSIEALPPDVARSFRKPPIAVVKFFQEDTYEFVKNVNSIYKYNCSRKEEFIKKGLYMFRTKHGHMEKFPEDVIRAETAVGGDIEILSRDEFQETKKESYAGIFGDPKKTPNSIKKGKSGKGRPRAESPLFTPIRKIKEKTDYKVHILVQGSKNTPEPTPNVNDETIPSTSGAEQSNTEDNPQDDTLINDKHDQDINQNNETLKTNIPSTPTSSTPSKPTSTNTGTYECHACPFTTTRLNVLILHNKTHSVSFIPYTPTPVKKKVIIKSTPKPTPNSTKSKPRKPRKIKTEKPPKKVQTKKRGSEEIPPIDVKKSKTDEEIKSSLLADWDDDIEDESNDESSAMVSVQSPEIPVGPESPAVPTPAEVPSAQIPAEIFPVADKKSSSSPSTEKPESSSDSKYEFCEDEDWPEEADIGRKIPRVKNPIRTEDIKSVNLDEEEVAREVAELLNKTAVPELPSVPEPLKIEENFPERSIVKSPDKSNQNSPAVPTDKSLIESTPPKVIFKTKTFFRSRHSRSQDAIGKYVAEQLNAVEKMDIAENETNGSETVSSPEARDSPPIPEPVKVARLAPKIQLKKMKAEAAQLREREKMATDKANIDQSNVPAPTLEPKDSEVFPTEKLVVEQNHSEITYTQPTNEQKELLYPTQGIHPVDRETDVFDVHEVHVERPSIKDSLLVQEISKVDAIGANSYNEIRSPEDASSPILRDQYVDEATKLSIEDDSNENSQESEAREDNIETTKFSESSLLDSREHTTDLPVEEPSENNKVEPYMNESTASAVDALLSVSREPDRVPRVVSNDLPEDLFEDDNKDSESIDVNGDFSKNISSQDDFLQENCSKQSLEEHIEYEPKQVEDNVTSQTICDEEDKIETSHAEIINNDVVIPAANDESMSIAPEESINEQDLITSTVNKEHVVDSVPSESDLQIAEALINLPATAIQSNTSTEVDENVTIPYSVLNDGIQELPISENVVINETVIETTHEKQENVECMDDGDILNTRFETEQEKSENLNAAQSLVQMSEFIEHKTKVLDTSNIADSSTNITKQNDINSDVDPIEQNIALLSNDNNSEPIQNKSNIIYEQSSSKLLKILEEPCKPKFTAIKSSPPTNQLTVQGKDKILNFDVAKSTFKSKPAKQKIIIRRTVPTTNKSVLNSSQSNVGDLAGSEKLILSRSGSNQDGTGVKTFTIQTSQDAPSDPNTIVIQQKIRKVPKTTVIQPKLQKIKPNTSLVSPVNEMKAIAPPQTTDDAMFDINSMPIVLSEDLFTAESIEKMPVVMSHGSVVTQSQNTSKLIKQKQTIIEPEKITISPTPHKQELKTLLLNPVSEVPTNKSITPNILSKSSKLRGSKPMLVIDKTTGKQKIIMTKSDPVINKEVKQTPTLIQTTQPAPKAEKFLILPAQSASPRPARTQKIVIDPQTGKAHVLVAKGSDAPLTSDNKPVSAKLLPSNSDTTAPGNTVMIITNAQGAQSRIVLTPEHEKILFPNKHQSNVPQFKAITQRINSGPAQKTVTPIAATKIPSLAPVKTPTRIVPKPKSAIITSKGQLIVGGRVATTAQNIAPMPELRPVTKRIIASEPKKLIQKSTSEPIIFLQQKSGAMMQLTASQFEHMQRTGQIVQQKTVPPVVQEKIVIQKVKPANDTGHGPKSRSRRPPANSPTPSKKLKQEVAMAPAAAPPPVVTLTPVQPPPTVTGNVAPSSAYSELENFEELLPSTAIARQVPPTEPPPPPPPPPAPAPAPEAAAAPEPGSELADRQLLAVPGEHFGALADTFYLCIEENGIYIPVDNRPLVLENNQLVPMSVEPPPQPERRDILEAALANSDVFHGDAAEYREPAAAHARVSETSTTLHQPIMTPLEMPSTGGGPAAAPASLEDRLAVIGVTPHAVPTSLELPITVTDPRIAPKTTDPLSGGAYGALPEPYASMPLLADDDAVGKSMPILTEEGARSPDAWPRAPGSDTSDASAEIPLQPPLQLAPADLHRS